MASSHIHDALKIEAKRNRDIIQYPWWFGGAASCFAVTVSHPLDLGTASPNFEVDLEDINKVVVIAKVIFSLIFLGVCLSPKLQNTNNTTLF